MAEETPRRPIAEEFPDFEALQEPGTCPFPGLEDTHVHPEEFPCLTSRGGRKPLWRHPSFWLAVLAILLIATLVLLALFWHPAGKEGAGRPGPGAAVACRASFIAAGMAKRGFSYRRILGHYFPGCPILKMDK